MCALPAPRAASRRAACLARIVSWFGDTGRVRHRREPHCPTNRCTLGSNPEPRTSNLRGIVPARRVHHVDLAVSDIEQSLAFYLDLLGPLGWEVIRRYPTYRGTEEVVYRGPSGEKHAATLSTGFGLRAADGGAHQYYGVGIEHIAFDVDTKDEVDDAYARATSSGAKIHYRPKRIATSRATTRSSRLTPTASGSKCFPGRQCRDRSPHSRRDTAPLTTATASGIAATAHQLRRPTSGSVGRVPNPEPRSPPSRARSACSRTTAAPADTILS
jgi:catechol 2,3-dioxygenase-like lactoylglutathione lyase family enzyme